MAQKNEWYVSSEGHGLSASIGGAALVGVVPVVQYLAGLIGLEVGNEEITSLVGTLVQGVGGLLVAFGIVRKVYNRFRK